MLDELLARACRMRLKATTLGADADVELPARDAPPGRSSARSCGGSVAPGVKSRRAGHLLALPDKPPRYWLFLISATDNQGYAQRGLASRFAQVLAVPQSVSRMNQTWAARPEPKTASNSQ